MQEAFLHHVWKLGKFDVHELKTTRGEPITIIDRGQWNHHAGPDFLNARMKIGSIVWEGHVEIHLTAKEWTEHQHHTDPAYNNVILHVVLNDNGPALTAKGHSLPTLELKDRIPAGLMTQYASLRKNLDPIPCRNLLPGLDRLRQIQWIERLAIDRLERKAKRILRQWNLHKEGEQAFFALLCSYAGGKVNQEAYMHLARKTEVQKIWKIRAFPQQIEAYLLGMAGLIPHSSKDVYARLLLREFEFLKRKWGLQPIDAVEWRFFRMRPANFPTLRLAQLSALYVRKARWLPWVLEASYEELLEGFNLQLSGYWRNHYVFDRLSKTREKPIGTAQIHKWIINVITPLRVAFSLLNPNVSLTQRTLDLLEQLPPESNTLIQEWTRLQVPPDNALHSQGLLELRKEWCTPKKCLRCAFGSYFLEQPHPISKVEEAFISTLIREP
jgi:hypothetical protein